jgi:hypothetical protein
MMTAVPNEEEPKVALQHTFSRLIQLRWSLWDKKNRCAFICAFSRLLPAFQPNEIFGYLECLKKVLGNDVYAIIQSLPSQVLSPLMYQNFVFDEALAYVPTILSNDRLFYFLNYLLEKDNARHASLVETHREILYGRISRLASNQTDMLQICLEMEGLMVTCALLHSLNLLTPFCIRINQLRHADTQKGLALQRGGRVCKLLSDLIFLADRCLLFLGPLVNNGLIWKPTVNEVFKFKQAAGGGYDHRQAHQQHGFFQSPLLAPPAFRPAVTSHPDERPSSDTDSGFGSPGRCK